MIYPIGIQSFEDLRKKGFVYVDKTAMVYELAKQGKYYFLSRPRRFGKSLLISTMEAYFKGQKELFKGLALEQLEKDWTEYPVLHLDLNTGEYWHKEGLSATIHCQLSNLERTYGVEPSEQPTICQHFQDAICNIYEKTGKQVVILIDEYDKPVTENIKSRELQEYFRNQLNAFYVVTKSCDRYIRFAFLTGVTRFDFDGMITGFNNFCDISFYTRYADICGFTENEIHTYFGDSMKEFALVKNVSQEEIFNGIFNHQRI